VPWQEKSGEGWDSRVLSLIVFSHQKNRNFRNNGGSMFGSVMVMQTDMSSAKID